MLGPFQSQVTLNSLGKNAAVWIIQALNKGDLRNTITP